MNGRINSFQSMGAVDGPGVRFVVFMQGCPLRCVYCHNPDTWNLEGDEYSIDDVFQKILRFKSYFGEKGGVTISGGEPLLQWEFVSELFRRLKEEGIHTALDTSGIGNINGAKQVLKETDLVLCDLKFSTEKDYTEYCGGDLNQVLSFLKLTEQMRIPLWIRHVVVPGLTDRKEQVQEIARMARQFSNLEKLELLPFKKLCTAKYDALGIPFPLAAYEECTDAFIEELYGHFIPSLINLNN
ncbi:MAG: pyruvate formate-lyase-activating protein [Bacillota bacterium]